MKAGRLVLYADLIIAVLASFLFTYIAFSIPSEFFPSPLTEAYARLFASLLLGISTALTISIASDLWTKAAFRKPTFLRRFFRPKPMRSVRPRVKPLSEELSTRFVSGNRRLRSYAEKMSLGVASDILRAGETLSPYRLMAKHLFFAFVTLLLAVPVGAVLAITVHPILLFVMVLPAVPLAYPWLKLRSVIGDRKRELEDEVPFFTVFASIMQSVGISLYNSLLMIIGKGVFKQIEKDALLVKRDVDFFSKSPVEALEDMGRNHPNEKMRTLVLGYTSEWRSGGDMSAYLDAKADDHLRDMEFRWKQYANRASDIGETTISLLFVFPLMILMAAFIFPGQALVMTSLMLAFIVPLMTVVVFGAVNGSQPKTYDLIRGDIRLPAVAFTASLIISVLLQVPVWLSIAVSLAVATALYGAAVLLQLREIGALEKALPQFLRDVTEYRKMGYDITRAIIRMSEENTYNPVFDALLNNVAKQLSLGVRMAEVEVQTRSWLTRMCFFLLGQVVESGGGTARCLETLTNFVNQVTRVKKEAKASMRLYQFLSLFTPIGLSFITALMFALLTAFSAALVPGAEAGILGEIAQIPQALIEQCYLLVIVSSICVALLSTKAATLTAKNTLWITVNLAIAAGGIALSSQIASLVMMSIIGTT